jgi:hypothetical protein
MSPHRNYVALWAALLLALLVAVALPAVAVPGSKGTHPPSLYAYDKAHEITFNGTISEVVSHPAKGSLIGMHMMVASGGTTRDVHLGPYLHKEVTENAFRSNQPVQIVGMNVTLHGKSIVLARQVITGGRLITVRNEHGFLVIQGTKNPARRIHDYRTTAKGGRQ